MLINCVLYQDGKRIRDIPVDEIGQWIGRGDSFVWVALRDATNEELAAAQTQFDLPDLAIEDVRNGHQRPKIEEYGDTVFAVLHLIESSGHDVNVGELAIFAGRDYVLSVRNRSEQGFLGVRARCEREPELLRYGSSFVLYALMDAVVDRYFPLIDAFEIELEAIEEKIFDQGAARSNVQRLYALKHKVMILRHAVAPLSEAMTKLYGGRVPALCAQTQEYFRDISDHLYRINGGIDTIRDTISTAIQVNLAMVTIETGEVGKRLTGWAAIFAVATTIVGIWGMNFEHMPELKWEYGYVFALAVIAGVCGVMWYYFRRAKWL
ncbi:MAG TPA: magnesium and cobalt transport protein CorA [Burkholderiaceae bacterium]|nr:magnesium and cobalt transport protein CorA [Burkholderiaceae bacterium]